MTEKIEELRQVRIQKLEELKKQGIDPYPITTKRTHTIGECLEKFDKFSIEKKAVILAGRIRSVRTHGKLAFFDLEDESENASLPCVRDRKSTRLNSSHQIISYAVFCFKKKTIPTLQLY